MSILDHKNLQGQDFAESIKLDTKTISENGEFEGLGAVFGNIDRGYDKILQGAFSKDLGSKSPSEVRLLRSHDGNKIIGEWLDIKETKRGLYCKGRIYDDLDLGKETLFLMRKGQLNGLSIGYQSAKTRYVGESGKTPAHRELIELMLFEISVVTFAMNPKASVNKVKGDVSLRDVESALREAGVSSMFAKMIATHGFDEASRRVSSHREDGIDAKAVMAEIKKINHILKGKLT